MSKLEPVSISVRLKTVTPVSVGDDKGSQLSPYADYVFSYDGKTLHYLDLAKLEKAVAEKNAIDDYVKAIRGSINNNRAEFDLESFITGKLGRNVLDFAARSVPQSGIRPGQRVPISCIVKNGRLPYLPGSSIKGALRTALMYNWLLSDDGTPYLDSYADSVAEYRTFRDQWFRMKKERDFRHIKDVELEVKKHDRAIFNEDDLFGSLRTGPEARFLRIRDTAQLETNALEVQALRRIRLVAGQGKSTIPQIVEAIPAGQVLESDISIVPSFKHTGLRFLNSANFEAFFEKINRFSMHCIANEIQELQAALDADIKSGFEKELDKLLLFYERLQERGRNGEVFLRLGFGKTVNDNCLILSLLNGKKKPAWHDFRAAYHKTRRENDFYPVTRLVTPAGLPMGWVSVEKG